MAGVEEGRDYYVTAAAILFGVYCIEDYGQGVGASPKVMVESWYSLFTQMLWWVLQWVPKPVQIR